MACFLAAVFIEPAAQVAGRMTPWMFALPPPIPAVEFLRYKSYLYWFKKFDSFFDKLKWLLPVRSVF